jgi:hypothetical protein
VTYLSIYNRIIKPRQRDPQPGSLTSRLDTIDREQTERAAVRLGMILPSGGQGQDDFPKPGPRQPLPKPQALKEPTPPPLSDPLLLAARQAAQAYETTAQEWTFEGYNAAIIAAVLPIHDAIRESGIEHRTENGT